MHEHTGSTLTQRSIETIVSLQTPEGAYPASPTFSAYTGYCWFRDGSFIADAVSTVGERDSAERFFDWCAGILVSRTDHIHDLVRRMREGTMPPGDEMLPTRFTFAGDDGFDDWWDFQLDGYGTWLWALAEHVRRHGADARRWASAIELTVAYLCASWHRPCYDWWEEHSEHVHISTLACIAAGLDAVAHLDLLPPGDTDTVRQVVESIHRRISEHGLHEGHLAKWLGSTAVDGSLAAALAPLGVVDPSSPLGQATLDVLERHLTVDGGTHRYLGDTFYGGGQWPLLSCFLGLAQLRAGNRSRAQELYDWAASTATTDGDLPEQVDQHLIAPGMRQEWLDRWGTVATPLLWSHAMLLKLGAALSSDPDAHSTKDDS